MKGGYGGKMAFRLPTVPSLSNTFYHLMSEHAMTAQREIGVDRAGPALAVQKGQAEP